MRPSQRRAAEIVTGVVVAAVMVTVLTLVFGGKKVVTDGRYEVRARFTRVDGLTIGADVRAAGITVGTVTDMQLDPSNLAITTLRIDSAVELDTDATAAIVTDGLFGTKFVELDIGGGEDFIEPGGEIIFTEESLIIDDLLDLIIRRGRQVQAITDDAATE